MARRAATSRGVLRGRRLIVRGGLARNLGLAANLEPATGIADGSRYFATENV